MESSEVVPVTKLSSMLECPICFNVPRDLPIHQCPAGHIICKSCRPSVTSCPTCRRKLDDDGTSSLAASMIDLVPHKCKFSEHGCEVRDYLVELQNHEEKCVERTVKCPACREESQLKKFEEHAKENDCWVNLYGIGSVFTTTIYSSGSGFMQWDGVSKHKGKEYDYEYECDDYEYVGNSTFIIKKYNPEFKTQN